MKSFNETMAVTYVDYYNKHGEEKTYEFVLKTRVAISVLNSLYDKFVIEGTELDQYLELNRMWLDDKAPRNSESMAISYAVRYIRSKFNKIKWIQSFADERCGGFGIVYQGANFDFYGEHIAKFWTLDNEVYHNSLMTRNPKLSKSAAYLQHHKERATSEELRQFRYIYWIDHKWKKKVLLKQKPYPKHYVEKPNNFEKVEAGGLFLNSFQTELSNEAGT